MKKEITILKKVSTEVNTDGARLELRKIRIDYENSDRETAEGYTFVWVYENNREFPPKGMGQVVFPKKELLELVKKVTDKDWFI